ncbi:MAG: SagB/ThcOx family dehydrogenase [Sedimentisphaerales bacterium]
MNRRMFLKAVPAIGVLGVTKLSFSGEAGTVAAAVKDANAAAGGKQILPVAEADGAIKLNPPDLNNGISLMQALKKRKTNRDISNKGITQQQLSDLLWAADGVNRPDGKRTSPAAMGIYCVDIYVVLPEGIYLYDAAKHELKPVAKGDFRKLAGMQDFVFIAPLNLVYVFTLRNPKDAPARAPVQEEKRKIWGDVEVGCMVQNVYLYCASQGLAAVVRGMVDQKKFGEAVKVKPEQIIVAQTIGYPK